MSGFMGDGVKVKGYYHDIPVSGRIISSRIISNQLMYEVLLDKPLSFRWRDTPVNQVLLSNDNIELTL